MQEKLEGATKVHWTDARHALLDWYKAHHRPLPWRLEPDPYRIWLCEIIMQQTRIDQGMRYWERFVTTWGDVRALAESPIEEVLKAWQGLGYYSRARNLHKAANIIAFDMAGEFPVDAAGWRSLPGVGTYTAAAIASICYREPVAAVDGNVLRVVSRFLDIQDPIDRPLGRKQIEQFASHWIHPTDAGTHNQALMELGALVCKPSSPDCGGCPLASHCLSAQNAPGNTPIPPVKQGKTKVKSVNLVFHVVTNGTHVWMQQRAPQGIWGGLWEFPSREVDRFDGSALTLPTDTNVSADNVLSGVWWGERFEHILSHRRLTCQFAIWHIASQITPAGGEWLTWDEAEAKARPRAIDRFWRGLEKSCLELGTP
jgi:A/G-specific adenine glycosylase